MPITPDKSIGFYRKWLLVDFPNQFKQIKENLIEAIPEVEFQNLAKKSLRILKELHLNPEFTKEGDFDERAKRYEERSNPVMRFIEEFCEEVAGENITLRNFTNSCNEYLKSKHLRVMTAHHIGKILRDEGFSVGPRKINDISFVVILNLRVKDIKYHQNHHIPILELHIERV
jgi:phage/plasmid-associated DNA primase